jgi:hypothetical protein
MTSTKYSVMMIVVVAQPYLCLLHYITATHTAVETKVKTQLSMFYPELANTVTKFVSVVLQRVL